jgi:hypothetical protein
VQRAAQAPGSHQLAPFPEGVADVVRPDALDPRPELELGRRLDLRVHPADVGNDVDQVGRGRAPAQALALEAPRAHFVPG